MRLTMLCTMLCTLLLAAGCGDAALEYGIELEPHAVLPQSGEIQRHERLCGRSQAASCTRLGQYYEQSGRSTIKAIEFYLRGCNLGDGDRTACGVLAEISEFDISSAFDVFGRSCDPEQPLACYYQAALLELSQEAGRLDEQLQLARQACSLQVGRACYLLAKKYYEGAGDLVRADTNQAALYLSRACKFNDPLGCARLSALYATGFREIRQNIREAHRYAARSCYLNLAEACRHMAELYTQGAEQVGRDYKKAADFLAKACTLEDAAACLQLAHLYEEGGFGLEPAPHQAFAMHSKACQLQSAEACMAVGLSYLQGRGVAADAQRAQEYLQLGCSLGAARGCEQSARLQAPP